MFGFLFPLLWFCDCHSLRISLEVLVGALLLNSEGGELMEEGLWASTAQPCLQLGRSSRRRPATLDSRSYAFWCFWTAALTFLPTRFCFLKDCVQELFCCFHLTLPVKVFLKAGWAAFPSAYSLFFHLAKSFFSQLLSLRGRGMGIPVDFPSIGNVALTSFH